jgi:hypothetical protein
MAYVHTQTGWPVRIAFGVTALGLAVMAALGPLDRPFPAAGLAAGAVLTAALGLVFSRLTVRIDPRRVHWAFGPGWPRFSLPLDDISAIEATHTTFWDGWGIRRVRGGWLYNVAGRDVVRLTRRDGRLVLLGTDQPRRLKAALERARAKQGAHR